MRPFVFLCCAAFAFACSENKPPAGDPDAFVVDAGIRADATVRQDAMPSDPCAASDLDGDGFGTHASCPVTDCNDGNQGIFPGAPEACNNLDEDCDQQIDEDLGEGTCGDGACRRTVSFCMNGRPVACTPAMGVPEMCNGQDDDCNGTPDDGLIGTACGSGACERRSECVNGSWTQCMPGAGVAESCNRADDDCDGTIDNGFRATYVDSTYSVLVTHHSDCNGSGERIGSNCNAAMHRFCASQGCTTSGFGPLENFNDVAAVACVAAEPGRDVPYAQLAQHHPPCDGNGERIGPNCNAAMHRYCISQGFISGFGPAEQGPSSALVICLRAGAATVISTLYSELVNHHGGCNQTSRIGPDCNAAIHRFCRSQGFVAGYGPVENSGDTAIVTCVSP